MSAVWSSSNAAPMQAAASESVPPSASYAANTMRGRNRLPPTVLASSSSQSCRYSAPMGVARFLARLKKRPSTASTCACRS